MTRGHQALVGADCGSVFKGKTLKLSLKTDVFNFIRFPFHNFLESNRKKKKKADTVTISAAQSVISFPLLS